MPDSEKEKHVKQLKRKMECWREIIVPLNSILLWEKSWYPGLIVGSTSAIFLFIWIMEPTFLTIISLTLLLFALVDYLVPILSSTFISPTAWNGQKERKFDDVCQNLSETILQIQNMWKYILSARNNRSNMYYGTITLCLSLLAWLGNMVNNLLLIFVALNAMLLLPGIRYKGRGQSALKLAYNYLMHPHEQNKISVSKRQSVTKDINKTS